MNPLTIKSGTITLAPTPAGIVEQIERYDGSKTSTIDGTPVDAATAEAALGSARNYTVEFEQGDFSFEAQPGVVRAQPVELSFECLVTDMQLDGGTLLDAIHRAGSLCGSVAIGVDHGAGPDRAALTMCYRYTPAAPKIGALRRWAAEQSETRWHRRSIASWRWMWRQRCGGERTLIAENVTFDWKDPETLVVRGGVR